MLELLEGIPDHRGRRGRRYSLSYLLGIVVAAFSTLAFANLLGAATWAASAPEDVLIALGGRRDLFTGRVAVPSESALGRAVRFTDPHALEGISRALTAKLLIRPLEGVHEVLAAAGITPAAADGKVVRGSARKATVRGAPAQSPTYLVAVLTHATTTTAPIVIAQGQADLSSNDGAEALALSAAAVTASKKGEAAAARQMLAELDLTGTVVTFDAAHIYPDTAATVLAAGGHYVIACKANQPKLMAAAENALVEGVRRGDAAMSEEITSGSGRHERRRVQVVHVTSTDAHDDGDGDGEKGGGQQGQDGLAVLTFPGVRAVVLLTRWRKASTDAAWASKEMTLLLTSLPHELATPEVMAVLARGHWSVEVRHEALRLSVGGERPQCSVVAAAE